MPGLWHVRTKGIPPGTVFLIGAWLVSAVVLVLTVHCLARGRDRWRAARLLDGGLVVLSLYFVLHAIDLTVRQSGAVLTYGYILITSLNAALRTLSDVLVLAGYWQTMERFQTPKVANLLSLSWDPEVRKHWIKPELIPIGLLWILGLYQVGLQFALCFAWLGFVDLDVINTIARARSGIEVGFAALYFTTFLVMGPSLIRIMLSRGKKKAAVCMREPLKHAHLDEVKRAMESLDSLFGGAIFAGMALSTRSFCEIVIVGQLNRWPAGILEIYLARDACYGLFSGVFLCALPFSLPRAETDDPWEMDYLITTRQEAELQRTLDSWPGDAHRRFKTKLGELTRNGQKTAPDVSQIFDALRGDLRAESTASPAQGDGHHRLLEGKLEILNTMQETVRDWVPVYKWDGRNEDNNVALQAADSFDVMSQVSSRAAPVIRALA